MTKGSSKEECIAVLEAIQRAHTGKPWFKRAFLDSDDHGLHVGVKVDRHHPDREQIAMVVEGVKVITYLIG